MKLLQNRLFVNCKQRHIGVWKEEMLFAPGKVLTSQFSLWPDRRRMTLAPFPKWVWCELHAFSMEILAPAIPMVVVLCIPATLDFHVLAFYQSTWEVRTPSFWKISFESLKLYSSLWSYLILLIVKELKLKLKIYSLLETIFLNTVVHKPKKPTYQCCFHMWLWLTIVKKVSRCHQ